MKIDSSPLVRFYQKIEWARERVRDGDRESVVVKVIWVTQLTCRRQSQVSPAGPGDR